jgi:DNA repair exonuclease SbcCD ATPase subunit
MIEAFAGALAIFVLGFTLTSLNRARLRISTLEGDLDLVENHNRSLIDLRDSLKGSLDESQAALTTTKRSLETVQGEKQEIEKQLAALVESAARLEKARAELELDLGKIRREHSSLEGRVIDFQGHWSRQLSTLEAEVSTLMRQLGEFRVGTPLPIPGAEHASASHGGPAAGPRLASGYPRAVSAEPALNPDPAAARRAP